MARCFGSARPRMISCTQRASSAALRRLLRRRRRRPLQEKSATTRRLRSKRTPQTWPPWLERAQDVTRQSGQPRLGCLASHLHSCLQKLGRRRRTAKLPLTTLRSWRRFSRRDDCSSRRKNGARTGPRHRALARLQPRAARQISSSNRLPGCSATTGRRSRRWSRGWRSCKRLSTCNRRIRLPRAR